MTYPPLSDLFDESYEPWITRGLTSPELAEEDAAILDRVAQLRNGASTTQELPTPVAREDRSRNPLRPLALDDMIGQEAAKRSLRRVLHGAQRRGEPLDHTLISGQSGLGKTTLANCIAYELDVDVYQVEAPVSHATLLQLRDVMSDRDILFIDEVHQQAINERRGRETSTQPEVLFNVMEDRTIVSGNGILSFPKITVMGATTDEGRLPEPFLNRFPLKPTLRPYTADELAAIATANAHTIGFTISLSAAVRFAAASRGVPRHINNFVLNAKSIADGDVIDDDLATEVVEDMNDTTIDGLNYDMQRTLIFLLTRCRQERADGEVTYKASVQSIATAIGKSRDTKAVQLRIEPFLIEQGFLAVGHGGRRLTALGIQRAEELLDAQDS